MSQCALQINNRRRDRQRETERERCRGRGGREPSHNFATVICPRTTKKSLIQQIKTETIYGSGKNVCVRPRHEPYVRLSCNPFILLSKGKTCGAAALLRTLR